MTEPEPAPPDPFPHWMLPAIVLAGVVCRGAQYLSRRSYWEDESFIVLNLKLKTASQLLGPLADVSPPQAAPPLWLLAQRAMVVLFGTHEYALRAVPLLCGIAALVAFALLARRLLPPPGAVLTVAMFAFSDRLVWHSAEVKPYITDVLIATLLLLSASRGGGLSRHPDDAIRRTILTSLVAAVGIWFSYPTVLVFAGVSLALLLDILTGEKRKRLSLWIVCNAMVVASFAVVLFRVIHRQQHPGLDEYWAEHMPNYASAWSIPWWLLSRLATLGTYTAGVTGALALLLAVLGCGWLWKSGRRRQLAVLLLPLVVTIAASFARQYPFEGRRINTFLLPGLILLAGFGLQALLQRMPTGHRLGAARVLPLALCAPQIVLCVVALFVPRTRAAMRPAVEYVLAYRQPGDTVYTLNYHQARCYWPDNETPLEFFVPGTKPAGRFWVLISYRPGRDRNEIASRLKPVRDVADEVTTPYVVPGDGGAAYLFAARVPPP